MENKELLKILGDFKRGALTLNEANEQILILFSISDSFSVDQMHQAYIDGYNEGFPEPCFDINKYH